MLKNHRWFVLFGMAILLFLFTKACSRVPIPFEKDCREDQGVITSIELKGSHDIILKLEDNRHQYYISRGLDKGLSVPHLKTQLLGQKITLKYPRYWTPLDPLGHHRYVSKLEYQDSIIFSDLKSG